MKRWMSLAIVGVLGVVLGVGVAAATPVVPADDMAARATCSSCHDLHGAVEWDEAPFQTQIWVLGDVERADYVFVNDLFPYSMSEPGTGITLEALLERYGAGDWARVAVESLDGGIVILRREYVTEHTLLVPYLEGVRLVDRNQHESTWLKGVRWVIVEGRETPLTVAGRATSLGRLLLGEEGALARTTVLAEGGDARYISPLDGRTYLGEYAHLYTGAPLLPLLGPGAEGDVVTVRDARGEERAYTRADLAEALIATVDGRPSLVLPERGRRDWVIGVVDVRPGA